MSVATKPALILLDCDGTLTDSHGAIVQAMQAAFAHAGLSVPNDDAVCDVIGLSLQRAICGLMGDGGQDDADYDDSIYQQVAQGYRQHYVLVEQGIRLFPHVRETLEALHASGYWLGVVTGKSKPGLLRVLEAFDLRDMFVVMRTADCTHSKPHPAMVLECMAEMGVTAAQTSVVGDAVFDMQMAKAAGVRALGVSFGVASSQALLQAGAMDVIDDFADLQGYFRALQEASISPTMADRKNV